MSYVPKDLQWQVIRQKSCFLHKQRGIKKPFSKERMNMTKLNSIHYNGLVQEKSLGIEPTADGKGVVLMYRKKCQRKPSKSTIKVPLKKHGRKTLSSIKHIMVNEKYRPDLCKLAQRRASQIMRSQRPVNAKRERKIKKKKAE